MTSHPLRLDSAKLRPLCDLEPVQLYYPPRSAEWQSRGLYKTLFYFMYVNEKNIMIAQHSIINMENVKFVSYETGYMKSKL